MAKRASTAEVCEVDKKIKKEEPKEETTPSIKDKLMELTKEELVEKYLALSADYETTRAKLKRAEGGEHIARIRYTLKDREHRLMAQDRCNARWKLLGDASALNQRRGLQMEAFVHDTLTSQREEIHGLKRDLDSAKAELNTLRGKAGDEHSKEFERAKKLKEENDKLRVDAKKKAEMEKQLSLSHKANAIYKAKFKEQEKELAERNSRIRQLEEAPRADEEDEEEGEGEEDGEEKEGEAKDGEETAAAEEDEPEELMLDDGHGEGEETVKADE